MRRRRIVVTVVVKETLKISIINCGKRSHRKKGRKSVRNDFGCNGGGAAAINYSLFARYIRVHVLRNYTTIHVGFIIIIIFVVDQKMFSFLGFGLWVSQFVLGDGVMKIKGPEWGKKGSVLFFWTIYYFFWKCFKDKIYYNAIRHSSV